MTTHVDTELQYDKYFLACVRTDLSNLSYGGSSDSKEKEKKVEVFRQLLEIDANDVFRKEPRNFIDAVISKDAFEKLHLKYSQQYFGTCSQIPAAASPIGACDIKISYGDGYSRIQAARECIQYDNQWWIVNLYDQDIGITRFLSSQLNRNNRSTAIPTGIVVRDSFKSEDKTTAKQIEIGLSKDSAKNLKTIKNRSKLDDALSALKDLGGLWLAFKGLKKSSLEGCDDQKINCLELVYKVWKFILTDEDGRVIIVTAQDVELLDSRAPAISSADREHIMKSFENNSLFTAENSQTRDGLRTRILSITSLIPTLNTYSGDITYLHEIVSILRLLLPKNLKTIPVNLKNIRSALRWIWKNPETNSSILVEDKRDGDFTRLTISDGETDTFEIHLLSMVLHAMRNGRLGYFAGKTESGKEKVKITEPTPLDFYNFGQAARTHGFHSNQIDVFCNIDVTRESFAKCLEDIRPQAVWEYNIDFMLDKLCFLYQELSHNMKKRPLSSSIPQDYMEVKVGLRYGRPVTKVLTQSASSLFLRYLNDMAVGREQVVTAHCVRMEFLRRFWGILQLGSMEFSEVGVGTLAEVTSLDSDGSRSIDSDGVISNDRNLREEQEHREERDELQIARSQIERYTAELTNYAKESEIFHQEDERKEDQIKGLTVAIEQAKVQVNQLTTEISQKIQEMAEIRKEIEEKMIYITSLESQVERAHVMAVDGRPDGELSTSEEVLSKRIQELEGISRKQQEENDSMQSKRKKEEGEVQTLVDQAAEKEQRLSSECESLQRRLKKAEDSTDEACRRNVANSQSREELSSKHQEIMNRMQREIDRSKADATKTKKANDDLTEKLKSLEQKFRDHQSSNSLTGEISGPRLQSDEQGAGTSLEEFGPEQLEERIQKSLRDMDNARLRMKEIKNQDQIIQKNLAKMTKAKRATDAHAEQHKRDVSEQDRKRRSLRREKHKLEDEIKLSLIDITNSRYELLVLNGAEALFYEKDPPNDDLSSQTPNRVPLKAGGFDVEFKRLKAMKFPPKISYKIAGYTDYIGYDDFQKWKSCLADPPRIDNATFYTERNRKRVWSETNRAKRINHLPLIYHFDDYIAADAEAYWGIGDYYYSMDVWGGGCEEHLCELRKRVTTALWWTNSIIIRGLKTT